MKIKFCGIRRLEDVAFCNELQPEYLGMILSSGFRRTISPETAEQLVKAKSRSIAAVGVFVNETPEHIAQVLKQVPLDVIQLHGSETAEIVSGVRWRTGLPVWKAVQVQTAADIQAAWQLGADQLILEGKAGGMGITADWELIAGAKPAQPFLLAGGLAPENVAEAAARVQPDEVYNMGKVGRFGIFGGQYVPETVMNAVHELEEAYAKYGNDPEFLEEYRTLLRDYAGRPSMLYYADRMTKDLGGCKIYLKREDLNHTGAHKINNVLGQILLAKKMGKKRIIAETGAGQHGVATATACAMFDMECEIYMGKEDVRRQRLNVYRMELLGAKVNSVDNGTATLKDAINEAMRDWATNIDTTFYLIGSVMGPHPYPTMVRDFQKVIGEEAKKQLMEKEGRLPDCVVACVGGGSNAIGMFYDFIPDESVRLVGAEAAGKGIDTKLHAATVAKGSLGIFHGMKSYFLQNEEGQIAPVYSISAGLDYPGVGPEHANLYKTGRAEYVPITDEEAVQALEYLSRTEGIIPAIESAHAVAAALKIAPEMKPDQIMIINISGRGDKDMQQIAEYRGVKIDD